jgi:hypothetical protein
LKFSPTEMNSVPSGAKCNAPELWMGAVPSSGRSSRATSLAAFTVSPTTVKRATRLCAPLLGTFGSGEGFGIV